MRPRSNALLAAPRPLRPAAALDALSWARFGLVKERPAAHAPLDEAAPRAALPRGRHERFAAYHACAGASRVDLLAGIDEERAVDADAEAECLELALDEERLLFPLPPLSRTATTTEGRTRGRRRSKMKRYTPSLGSITELRWDEEGQEGSDESNSGASVPSSCDAGVESACDSQDSIETDASSSSSRSSRSSSLDSVASSSSSCPRAETPSSPPPHPSPLPLPLPRPQKPTDTPLRALVALLTLPHPHVHPRPRAPSLSLGAWRRGVPTSLSAGVRVRVEVERWVEV